MVIARGEVTNDQQVPKKLRLVRSGIGTCRREIRMDGGPGTSPGLHGLCH